MPDALGRRVPSLSVLSAESVTADSTSTADLEIAQLRIDVARAVRSVCPRWLAEQADDLSQIAVSRILDRLRTTEGQLELSRGYLYRTAYSVVIDEIRRRRRRREIAMDSDVVFQSNEANPERHTFSREVRDAVAGCLRRLVASRRRAVTLHLLGHSVREISALLECRSKQAENLVYRGLNDLRVCLTRHGVHQ
jgi:RNA polymerase sigma-70 factor, ECF subfamily